MYRNTVIKITLGGSHLNCNAKALQHLTRSKTNDMQADDLLLGARADELISSRALVLKHGVIHGRELRLVHLNIFVTISLPCLRLAKTDAADLRVRKYDGGNVGVIKSRLGEFGSAEETICETATSGDGNFYYAVLLTAAL